MQIRRSLILSKNARRGFTLIELLVVISIIATLMALILPAIQSAREAARRTQCQNHMKNLTLAAINYAEAHRGQLPASGTYTGRNADNSADGSREVVFAAHSWVLELLPYLDQQAIFDRWDRSTSFSTLTNPSVGIANIAVLTCPNDDTSDGKDGGLSYVANCGVGDINFDIAAATIAGGSAVAAPTAFGQLAAAEPFVWITGSTAGDAQNVELTGQLSVFAPSISCDTAPQASGVTAANSGGSVNIGRIYDGAGNTIMLTENVYAGKNSLTGASTWADPSIRSCGFIFPIAANTGLSFHNISGYADTSIGSPYINGQKAGIDGSAPFPNSRHIGVIVASFCDGGVKTLNETLDRDVYVRLITPNAARQRPGITAETPLSSNEF